MKRRIKKFKNIPQFTRTPTYRVDMSISCLDHEIERYTKVYNLQLTPDFQRGHVWAKKQQIDYLEFFFRGGATGKEIYFNHPGWLINYTGDFVLVDGLQRITAFLDFLNNKIKIFGSYYKEFEDEMSFIAYTLKFNINDLKTRKEVLNWYLEMNSGGTVHSKKELNKVRELIAKEK